MPQWPSQLYAKLFGLSFIEIEIGPRGEKLIQQETKLSLG